jgi:hypothetical protein
VTPQAAMQVITRAACPPLPRVLGPRFGPCQRGPNDTRADMIRFLAGTISPPGVWRQNRGKIMQIFLAMDATN